MKLWAPPAYYVLTEVRNGTGYGRSEGYADVLAMSVWPSRGIELIGAELKVSRSDWLRELKDPAKAENFVKYCHRWYLIAGPDVAQEHEIPTAWGWMVAGPKGLKTLKGAPALEPVPPDPRFLASIFRNIGAKAQGMVAESEVDAIALKKANEMRDRDSQCYDTEYKAHQQTRHAFEQLRANVNAFSNLTGIHLETWHTDEAAQRIQGHWVSTAKLIAAAMGNDRNWIVRKLTDTEASLTSAATTIKQALEQYQTAQKAIQERLNNEPNPTSL